MSTATARVAGGLGTGYVVSSPDLGEDGLAALADALDRFGLGSPLVDRYMRTWHDLTIRLVVEGMDR